MWITTIPSMRRAATAAVAALAAMTLSAATAPAVRAQPVLESDGAVGQPYAAFGDSYSAGEGTYDYLPGTAIPGTNVCHRSPEAYSGVLDAERNLGSLGFVACSGAVTADLFAPNANGNKAPDGEPEPAQLCSTATTDGVEACGAARAPVLGPQTQTVTLTIGGNDLGFAKIVAACAFATIGKYRIGNPGRGCALDPKIVGPTTKRLAALNGIGSNVRSPYGTLIHPWRSVLATIHTLAPNAHVYIAGYPQLFQPTGTADCVIGSVNARTPVKIAAADATWVDRGVAVADAAIAYSAAAAGPWATYVDSQATFAGHGLCTSDPWINPITETISYDRATRKYTTVTDPGSVHPSVDGQKLGFAAAFVAAGIGS